MGFSTFDDVKLDFVKDLNTKILNSSFSKLVDNDKYIQPVNNYIPNIWFCKWYNDETVAGYSKGDTVWKYTMTTNNFLNMYGRMIYDNAIEKERIRNIPLSAHTSYSGTDKTLYLNIVNGYTEGGKQYYPRMFDFGQQESLANDIQIYISMVDDNKCELTDTTAWNNISLTSQAAYTEFITREIQLLFEDHVRDYHLNGITKMKDVNSILLRRDMSNFDENLVYNLPKVQDVQRYCNADGFMYVKNFVRQRFDYTAQDGTKYNLYRQFRFWSNGFLEHFGVVPVEKLAQGSSSQISDYYTKVDLEWPYIDASGNSNVARIYRYPTVSSFYEDRFQALYFADDHTEYMTGDMAELDPNCRYYIHLTPVQFDPDRDISADMVKTFVELSSYGYPESFIGNNKNSCYFNNEVCHIKNQSFCITKSDTEDLRENGRMQFYQYYTTGYSARDAMNMEDASMAGPHSIYAYTGSAIRPAVEVYDFNGSELVANRDYSVSYRNNVNCGTAYIDIIGISPYHGTQTKSFQIVDNVITDTALISKFEAYTPKNNRNIKIIDAKVRTRELTMDKPYSIPYSGYFKISIPGGYELGYCSKYLSIAYNNKNIYESIVQSEWKTKSCYLYFDSGANIKIYAGWNNFKDVHSDVILEIAGVRGEDLT